MFSISIQILKDYYNRGSNRYVFLIHMFHEFALQFLHTDANLKLTALLMHINLIGLHFYFQLTKEFQKLQFQDSTASLRCNRWTSEYS